jgi:hypothetical protein
MCLIAYVPAGQVFPEDKFRLAAADNSDGIGIMSAKDGVAKFVGRKATKRALRYARALQARGVQHAVHFRYATHGRVDRANCHPHRMPVGGWLMHNGVLSAYARLSTDERSDTAVFTETLTDVPETAGQQRTAYWHEVGRHIGSANKLVVLHNDGRFEIVNATSGEWIDGVWYSQTYSLYPAGAARGWRSYTLVGETATEDDDTGLAFGDGDDYSDMLRRALERRYGFPIEPSDVPPGADVFLDDDRTPTRYSDWRAARRERDSVATDDYSEYMLAAGLE